MKTSSISRRVAVIRWWRPTGATGLPGSVTSSTSAASRVSSSAPSSCALRASIAPSSARRASLAARPTAPRSSGGSWATPRSRFGSSALRPRKRTRTSSSAAVSCAPATAFSPCWRSSAIRSSTAAHPTVESRRGRRSPPCRRSATRLRIGMCATSSQAATTALGRPSRSAPTTTGQILHPALPVASLLDRRERTPSRATSAIRRPGSSATLAHAGHRAPRTARPSRPARPWGRTGRRCRGRARRSGAERERERSAVPTLPGSLTPHSARQTGPDGRGRPALAVDAERARARAELGHRREHVRRDRHALQPAALGGVERLGRPAGARGGLDQVLPLGDEQPQLVPPLAAGELADLLELFVVGAGDRHRAKKGRRSGLEGRPEVGLSSPVRPSTPRGRSRQIGGRSRGRARRCRPAPCGPARCRPA